MILDAHVAPLIAPLLSGVAGALQPRAAFESKHANVAAAIERRGAFPHEVQEAYGLFAARCSRCHTLAHAINTNLSAESWKLYVKKMMSKPGSGISPEDGKTIYRFLAFYQVVKDKQPKR